MVGGYTSFTSNKFFVKQDLTKQLLPLKDYGITYIVNYTNIDNFLCLYIVINISLSDYTLLYMTLKLDKVLAICKSLDVYRLPIRIDFVDGEDMIETITLQD